MIRSEGSREDLGSGEGRADQRSFHSQQQVIAEGTL